VTSRTGAPSGSPPAGRRGREDADVGGQVGDLGGCIVAFPGQGVDAGSVVQVLERARGDELVAALAGRHAAGWRTPGALSDPAIAQPAMFVASMVRARSFRGRTALVVGHSLGEIAALVFAGAMDAGTGLDLAHERGRACHEVTGRCPGQMIVVLGLTEDRVEALREDAVRATGEVLDLAAVNAEHQAVLSGTAAAAAAAAHLARAAGGHTVALPIHGPFHSRLMAPARERFLAALLAAPLTPPCLPWRSTIDGWAHTDPAAIRTALADALVEPVRWSRTISTAAEGGAFALVDVGPDEVLARLEYPGGVRAVGLDGWPTP
jgi:[acyl-carrier-protein] S-malonyltransferase